MYQSKNINYKQRIVSLLILFFMAGGILLAQNSSIKGVVIDKQNNETLPGVSVTVKGTTNGTLSDLDGKFAITAGKGTTLVITYLGYETQEVAVSNTSSTIKIQLLPQSFDIGEVTVVGTRMKKSDLTGAIGGISQEQLKEIPTTDLTTAMQGKVPGLNISRTSAAPGSDISMKVRGTNSISYGTNPVFVIDGIVAEEGLRLIDPNEIASIEVLKDASSTALYGSKASNGVIVITTKKGRKGEGKVNYSGFVTFSSYQNRLKTLGSKDMMNLRIDAYANGYMDTHPDADRNAYIKDYVLGTNKVFSAEELENGMADRTSNWIDEITRTGIEQNHSVNFSGGSDKSTYFVGFSYSNNQGVLDKSSYERFNGRINFETQVKPWLKIGTNTSISRGIKNRLDDNAYETALLGNKMQNIDTDRLYMYFQGVAQMGRYNPILTKDIDSKEIHDRVLTNNFIEINPIKDLYVRTSLSADIYNKQDSKYIPSYVGQSVRDNKDGEGWQWRGQTKYYQWDNSVSYEKTFNKKHRLFGFVSTSISKTRSNNISMSGYKFASDDLGSNNMGMAGDKEKNSMSSDYKTNTLISYIARANYSYEYKYQLTATVRRDGSSKFADGQRWGTFPSVSAAWTISEEEFLKNANLGWLDILKLRIGYGVLGNQNIPEYGYTTIYSPGFVNNDIKLDPEDGRYGNKGITWEKQKQWNFGLDATLWNDRITLGLDYFSMVNSDLLMKMSYWPSFGYSYQIANVAELQNKGIEFSVSAQMVKSKDWNWSVSGNIAHDKNKIKKLFGGVDVLWNGGNVKSRDGNLFVGQSLNTLWGYKVNRLAQESDMSKVNGWTSIVDGKVIRPGDLLPEDINKDGKITAEDDMTILGKTDPKFYGGFSTNLNYRDFYFDAVFTYSYGIKKFDWIYEYLMSDATISPAHEDMLKRWTPENTNTSIPRAYHGDGQNRFSYGETSYGLMNASFLRCATMSLTYKVPKSLIGKYFDNISVTASGNNLFTITPYKGYDPESGQGYPLSRSFTFGLNVGF